MECVMLTPEQVRQVAEHLALHLPAIVQEKTERGALVAPANQKRLYLDVTEVETVLRTASARLSCDGLADLMIDSCRCQEAECVRQDNRIAEW